MRYIATIALLLLMASPAVFAAEIECSLTNLGGIHWQYDCTIANDPLASFDINVFTIWFDLDFYDNLESVNIPAEWEPDIIYGGIASDIDYGFNGFTDNAGIVPGESLGGFQMAFDWLGIGIPAGSHFFEIVDPHTWQTVSSGFTTHVYTLVPEPHTFVFLLVGLAGVFTLRYRMNKKA